MHPYRGAMNKHINMQNKLFKVVLLKRWNHSLYQDFANTFFLGF